MGRFQFLVQGYENDPAELYGIPDVRKFYQHFHRVWSCWFFFWGVNVQKNLFKLMGPDPAWSLLHRCPKGGRNNLIDL